MWNQKRYIYSLYWGLWDLNSLTLNRSQYDYNLSDQRKEWNAEVSRSLGPCLVFCVIQIYTKYFFFSTCCFTPHFCVKIYIYIIFFLKKNNTIINVSCVSFVFIVFLWPWSILPLEFRSQPQIKDLVMLLRDKEQPQNFKITQLVFQDCGWGSLLYSYRSVSPTLFLL